MPKSSKRTKRSTAAKTPTAPNSLTTLSVNTPEEAKLWVSCEYLLGDSYDQEAVEAAAFTVYGPKNRILVKDENWKITQLLAPRKLDDHERPRLFKAGVEGEAKWEKQRVGLKVTLNSWDEAAKNKEILEYVRAAVADTLREIWGARRDRYYFLVVPRLNTLWTSRDPDLNLPPISTKEIKELQKYVNHYLIKYSNLPNPSSRA